MLTNTSICLEFNGAGGGIRTRDPNLGKVVLYQLSYTRSIFSNERLSKYNKVVYPCQHKIALPRTDFTGGFPRRTVISQYTYCIADASKDAYK